MKTEENNRSLFGIPLEAPVSRGVTTARGFEMDLSRAMALVEYWRKDKNWPTEPDKQTPMQQALLAMHSELTVDRLLELHARVREAEEEADWMRKKMQQMRTALAIDA